MEGFTTPETYGKWSLRAAATGELVFNNVKIPSENLIDARDKALLNLDKLKWSDGFFRKDIGWKAIKDN